MVRKSNRAITRRRMYGRGCVGSKCVTTATALNNRTISNASSEGLLNANMLSNNTATSPILTYNANKVSKLFTPRKRRSLNRRITRRRPTAPK